ncbi:MAG TPA: GLUG motif-containing protein, partial [Polyangiales bacterium]|nr:GLUG motif-containing protein [Polyangiales bacterium]
VGSQRSGKIEQSFALGTATGAEFVGGLLGSLFDGQVLNCYARATVTAAKAGGLVGSVQGATGSSPVVENSYAASTLSGTDVRGLFGEVVGEAGSVTVTNSYYLNTAADTFGTVLPASAFRNQASFVGWDFSAVWRLTSSYPSLSFE